MARRTLTSRQVAALKPKAKRYTVPDPELRGHYVRVTPTGAKSYVVVARNPHGKQIWATIGPTDELGVDDARERARQARRRIKDGLPAFELPTQAGDTFKTVAENWLKRHVKAKRLRSEAEVRRVLNRDIYPAWQDREFVSIRRTDVTELLDTVEDNNGPSAADHVLSAVRAVMNWYETRSDDYASPIARGMRRTDPKARKRDRLLDDDELRLLWKVAEDNGAFGAIVRLALLTAQRREKLGTMRWADISIDGIWNIPAEEREKGTPGALELPEAAQAIIRAQPRIEGNPFVFPGRGDGHLAGWSPFKRQIDAKTTKANGGKPMKPWRFHDLRRTSRSLMARAGVRPDIAERVMGHAIQGIEGIYNRHAYTAEKADALKRLTGLVEMILKPPGEKVVTLRSAAE